MLDEEGRTRLKLKVWADMKSVSKPSIHCLSVHLKVTRVSPFLPQVENTIRWRVKRDEEGNETRESNARIVKWSDGRCVLCQAGCRGYS